jgi:nitrate/TMAO reductase-like tetraheme cytochrome c subunit
MKKALFILLAVFAVAGFAMAQMGTVTTDSLGAHLNYGRGCAACHAPHSGAYGNGAAKTGYSNAGVHALWGQDVGSLVGQVVKFGDSGTWTETLPGLDSTGVDRNITECLSCHDGNLAQGAMMKNAVFEPLPSTYGKYNTIPTLLGNDGTGSGNYLNDHPVGLLATVGCAPTGDWDCTVVGGKIMMTGTNSAAFYNNYGWFVNPKANAGIPTVTCTTCHHQHVQNISVVTQGLQSAGGNSGLASGTYLTMFFVRGLYNPASGGTSSNQTAQFCRQCHGGESNEMNGSSAGTTF